MNKNTPSPSIAAIIANPHSTKEQAYELGFDAGRISGLVEANQQIDKIFAERFMKPTELKQ